MRVAGDAIGAIGDHGKLVPSYFIGEPIHGNAVVWRAAAFAFARLLQLLVYIELDALDAGRRIGSENLDIEDDTFNDLLVVRGK